MLCCSVTYNKSICFLSMCLQISWGSADKGEFGINSGQFWGVRSSPGVSHLHGEGSDVITGHTLLMVMRREGSRNRLSLLWSRLGIINLLFPITFYWPKQLIWTYPVSVGQEVYVTSSGTVELHGKGHGTEWSKELGTIINLPHLPSTMLMVLSSCSRTQ